MSLDEKLSSLLGLTCTDITLIVGGSLILHLGERPDADSLTEWRLHLEPAWRIDTTGGPLIGSFDTPESSRTTEPMLEQLNKVCGQRLTAIDVGTPVLDLQLSFEGIFTLKTFAHSVWDGENWELRHCSGLRIGMCEGNICDWTRWHEHAD